MSKATLKNSIISCSLLILFLLVAPLQVSAQVDSSPKLWTVKLNLLSPVWKNIGLEVEYKTKPRFSFLMGAGINRAYESLPSPESWECIARRGFGLAAGGKYFLAIQEKGKRTVNGIALKASLNYTFTDEFSQLCPSFLPMELHHTHGLALNTYLSVQKTFFDRILVEAQAGVGALGELVKVKNSERLILSPSTTRFSLVVPLAVNVGFVF